MNEPSTNAEIITSDLPCTAFALSRHSAVLIDHDVSPSGKVFFRLSLPDGIAFPEIESQFYGNAHVGGLAYSESIRRLKRIVISARRSQGVIL